MIWISIEFITLDGTIVKFNMIFTKCQSTVEIQAMFINETYLRLRFTFFTLKNMWFLTILMVCRASNKNLNFNKKIGYFFDRFIFQHKILLEVHFFLLKRALELLFSASMSPFTIIYDHHFDMITLKEKNKQSFKKDKHRYQILRKIQILCFST